MIRSKFMPLAILMAAAEATASTGAAPTANTEVPASTGDVAPAAAKTRAPKNPDNKLDIINGRLPLPLVFLIRFKETGTNNDLAKKYGTSVGKVFDIKKGRNFGYIDANYLPSAEEMTAAKAWCETGKTAKGKSLKEAGGDPDGILSMLGTMTVATAEQVAGRNWQIREVGKPAAAGQAPAAAPAPAAAGAQTATAEKPQGAKLF